MGADGRGPPHPAAPTNLLAREPKLAYLTYTEKSKRFGLATLLSRYLCICQTETLQERAAPCSQLKERTTIRGQCVLNNVPFWVRGR